MSVCSSDLLALAQALADDEFSEAHHRSAASRAYYAAFLAADELDKSILFPDEHTQGRGGPHDQVMRRLKAKGYETQACMLRDMKNIRHYADYKINGEFSRDQALETVMSCKELTANLQNIRSVVAVVGP
ncbi:hypothetical protein [Pseudomonas sp. RC10]|uniref:hypothetical protein n=1 Tax=Pseudomonas bambusae TaxID=3139142 RepID=UPI00313A0F3F